MTLYPKLILDALATVRYPGTGKNLVEAEMVADNLRIDGMSVSFSLIFEKPTVYEIYGEGCRNSYSYLCIS